MHPSAATATTKGLGRMWACADITGWLAQPQCSSDAVFGEGFAGVVLLGRTDGRLETWNLLDRTHAPVVVAPVTPSAILAVAFSPGPTGAASRSSTHHVSLQLLGRSLPLSLAATCPALATLSRHFVCPPCWGLAWIVGLS